MTTVERPVAGLAAIVATVPRPEPVLSPERTRALTPRQRELLLQLTELARDGFSHLTMADIASHLNCSLRTLYGIASGREELVLVALDRSLWDVGRNAMEAVGPDPLPGPVEAIRRYLAAANVAVGQITPEFARDLAAVPGGEAIRRAHSEYLVAVTSELLDHAVEQGDIASVDTVAVARAMAGLGRLFSEAGVIDSLDGTPKDAADHVVEIILRGLRTGPGTASRKDPCTPPNS